MRHSVSKEVILMSTALRLAGGGRTVSVGAPASLPHSLRRNSQLVSSRSGPRLFRQARPNAVHFVYHAIALSN